MSVMKIKLSVSASVQRFDNQGRPTFISSHAPGDIVEMASADAQRFIDRGFATAANSGNNK